MSNDEYVNYPKIGYTYRHYKGGLYEVLTLCTHTETNEVLVIYRSLLFGSTYARPLTSWNSDANGKQRFTEE